MKPSAETALITGASSGIGLELARCFAGEGSNLVLVARNLEALQQLAAELESKHHIKVRSLRADLSLPETPERIFEEVSRLGITVDVLVNNAGFGLQGEFLELPLPRQLEMIQVNITALTHLTSLFLPAMARRGFGGVLNVGSVAGFLPGPNLAVYYASKAFVLSFTEALAAETRFSSRLKDTGDPCAGGAPPWMDQTGLSRGLAMRASSPAAGALGEL